MGARHTAEQITIICCTPTVLVEKYVHCSTDENDVTMWRVYNNNEVVLLLLLLLVYRESSSSSSSSRYVIWLGFGRLIQTHHILSSWVMTFQFGILNHWRWSRFSVGELTLWLFIALQTVVLASIFHSIPRLPVPFPFASLSNGAACTLPHTRPVWECRFLIVVAVFKLNKTFRKWFIYISEIFFKNHSDEEEETTEQWTHI